ncbi:hypothetical protein ACFQ3N_14815 [Virgibacillus byunsanensis]|uniref:Uncharacterized protein n=1 Tax=Virgibacillus byunsanensis TaxID=570945 RepID=A0ABW3LQS0_9BACI
MNYTPEMEKAMQQSHGMSFEEYGRKLENRITVEMRRQQEYRDCQKMVAQFDKQIHK